MIVKEALPRPLTLGDRLNLSIILSPLASAQEPQWRGLDVFDW